MVSQDQQTWSEVAGGPVLDHCLLLLTSSPMKGVTFYPLCPVVGRIVGANLWDIPGALKPQLLKLQVVASCGVRNCVYVWWWWDPQDIWPPWKVSEHAATKK